MRKYNKSLSPDAVSYIGIATDEPKRLARLDGTNKVSLLAKYGYTELTRENFVMSMGCFLRFMVTAGETDAGSAPMPAMPSCAT